MEKKYYKCDHAGFKRCDKKCPHRTKHKLQSETGYFGTCAIDKPLPCFGNGSGSEPVYKKTRCVPIK